MTIRTKTIEVPLDSRTTTLATATTHTFTTQTIYIPETTSRTFRTVELVVIVKDAQATAFNLTAITVGITLGAAGASNQAFTNNPTSNSGEHQTWVFTRDCTSYFTTNFGAGASQTFIATFVGTGGTTANICAKLVITYDYDDSATTRIKTIRIPIESTTGALTATLAAVGTSQIPALDTFLPEASKTYRHIWFEVIGNGYEVGTVNNPTLNFRIDAGGTTHSTGAIFTALASATYLNYIWNIGTSGFTTNATHDLHLAASTVTTAATFNHLGLLLCVSYEYDESTTSTVMNSLLMAAESVDFPGSTAAGDQTRTQLEFWVEEPATVTLVQSGVMCVYTAQGAVSPTIQVGSQTARTYTDVALLYCGCTALMQRFDSGASGGSGHTLTRGKNQLVINTRIGTVGTTPTGLQQIVYLNYTSAKSVQGSGAHNHSIYGKICDQYTATAATQRYVASVAPIAIAETNYWINNVSSWCQAMVNVPSTGFYTFGGEIASGELQGDGWTTKSRSVFNAEAELGYWLFADEWDINIIKRNPNETGKLDIEASRRWRYHCFFNMYVSLGLWVTYHTITFTVSGDIANSSGGTVTIDLHRDSDGQKLAETSRTGNGTHSFTWYDNTENLFTEAYESATLIGRSDTGTATGSP